MSKSRRVKLADLRHAIRSARKSLRKSITFREKALRAGLIEPHGILLPSLTLNRQDFVFKLPSGTIAMANAKPRKIYRLIEMAYKLTYGGIGSDYTGFFKLAIETSELSSVLSRKIWRPFNLKRYKKPHIFLTDWLRNHGMDANQIGVE